MDQMFVFLQNLYVTPNIMVIGGLWEVSRF